MKVSAIGLLFFTDPIAIKTKKAAQMAALILA
jgi:hypothetical protein